MSIVHQLPDRRPLHRRPAARRILLGVGAPLALLLVAGAAVDRLPPPVLINETASLPRGLYVRVPGGRPERGALAALPQPQAARPYLARLGVPPDLPLIKRVVAVGGDGVCADGQGLIAPFRSVRVQVRDRGGRALPVWRGCRRLAPDEVLLLGDSADSFDGRHFGPVRRDRLLGVYRAVLTW